jgi:hypothetical protein
MLNTKVGENFNDNNVINSNDLRRRLLNIDSRFRTNITEPAGDFLYRLEHTYKNVIRIRVASVEIPNSFYTFSAARQNTTFRVSTTDISNTQRDLTITIPDGNYDITNLITEIQDQFNATYRDLYCIYINVTININTGRITIENQGLSLPPYSDGEKPTNSANPITFDFSTLLPTNRHNGLGLGYNLGFRQLTYTPSPSATVPWTTYAITGESIVDTVDDTYLLLGLNDLHTVEHKTDTNYFQNLAKIPIREDKYAIIFDDGSSLISNEIVFSQPQNITVLNIKLTDAYGEIIDLNGLNYSITLEITEVLNTRLYNFYRNYIWLGGVPSVPVNSTNNAGSTLLNGQGPAF